MASVSVSPFQGPFNNTPFTIRGVHQVPEELWDLNLWVALGCMAMPIPGEQFLLPSIVFLSWDYTKFKQQNGFQNGAVH